MKNYEHVSEEGKFELTGSEWHDTCPQITRMERHVNTRERNGSKSSFELDKAFSLLLLLCLFEASFSNFTQHLFYFVHRKFSEELEPCQKKPLDSNDKPHLGNVDFLNLEIIKNIRQGF
jgi:hypothetical protein